MAPGLIEYMIWYSEDDYKGVFDELAKLFDDAIKTVLEENIDKEV